MRSNWKGGKIVIIHKSDERLCGKIQVNQTENYYK